MAEFRFSGAEGQVPPISDFNWLNQGSSTIEEANGRHLMLIEGASNNIRARTQSIPGTGSGWSITIHFEQHMVNAFHQCGIILRDSVSGRIILWTFDLNGTGITRQNWSSVTSFSSQSLNVLFATNNLPPDMWLRVVNDETNNSFQYSLTGGESWIELLSESSTAWLTNPADEFGYAGNCNSSTDFYFQVDSYTTTPASFVSPASIPGLAAWYDASDDSSITTDTSGNVSQWNDLSANINHLTQTGSNRPVLDAASVNGRDAILFDDTSSQYMDVAAAAVTGSPFTIFFVGKRDEKATSNMANLTFHNTGLTNHYYYMQTAGNSYQWGGIAGGGGIVAASDYLGFAAKDAVQVVVGHEIASNDRDLRVDGVDISTSTSTVAPSGINTLTIGRRGQNADRHYSGHICEVVIYDRSLTASEISSVEDYLVSKWRETPTQISDLSTNLQLHLDASDADSITVDSSGNITQWDDLSGKGNHVSQMTSDNQPTLAENAVNGLDAVEFDETADGGVGQYLTRSNGLGGTPLFAVAAVQTTDETLAKTILWMGSDASNGHAMASGDTVWATGLSTVTYQSTGSAAAASSDLVDNVLHVVSSQWPGTTGRVSRIDSGSQGFVDNTRSPSTPTKFSIGKFDDGITDRPWAGYICEILVFDKVLAQYELEFVENYLADKWGGA